MRVVSASHIDTHRHARARDESLHMAHGPDRGVLYSLRANCARVTRIEHRPMWCGGSTTPLALRWPGTQLQLLSVPQFTETYHLNLVSTSTSLTANVEFLGCKGRSIVAKVLADLDIRVCHPLPTLTWRGWFRAGFPLFPRRHEAAPTPNLTHPEYPVIRKQRKGPFMTTCNF
ncbi:hypothetical protein J6590_075172 [Homalodisca vitripennis]|nr:hypothetical protein J6590_075172 [Homalodisca vitripennis]